MNTPTIEDQNSEWVDDPFLEAMADFTGFLSGLAFMCLILAFFFLPAIIARERSHEYTTRIFWVNLLCGWSGGGWIAALVWALSVPGRISR